MKPAELLAEELDDDSVIVERSWREPEQFAVLFDRHAPRIHRYVARRIGRQVADDVVAETFLAAFAKRRQYCTGYRDAGPWLYGIATNLIGQHRRDEVRQFRTRRAALADLDVPGPADRVSADLTARSVRSLLAAALAELTAGDPRRGGPDRLGAADLRGDGPCARHSGGDRPVPAEPSPGQASPRAR
jgi:RNA polymerase sigma-70 factor (ECF subfamily)